MQATTRRGLVLLLAAGVLLLTAAATQAQTAPLPALLDWQAGKSQILSQLDRAGVKVEPRRSKAWAGFLPSIIAVACPLGPRRLRNQMILLFRDPDMEYFSFRAPGGATGGLGFTRPDGRLIMLMAEDGDSLDWPAQPPTKDGRHRVVVCDQASGIPLLPSGQRERLGVIQAGDLVVLLPEQLPVAIYLNRANLEEYFQKPRQQKMFGRLNLDDHPHQVMVTLDRRARERELAREWEPRIKRSLQAAADQCYRAFAERIDRLRAWPMDPAVLAGLGAELKKLFKEIALQRGVVLKNELLELMSEETAFIKGSLSQHGLYKTGPLHQITGREAALITERYYNKQPLDQVILGSTAKFTKKVLAKMEKTTRPRSRTKQDGLKKQVRRLCDKWKKELGTIAFTTMRAVLIRTQFVVEMGPSALK